MNEESLDEKRSSLFLTHWGTAIYWAAAIFAAAWSVLYLDKFDSLLVFGAVLPALLVARYFQATAERRRLLERNDLSYRDDLTGLPNRRLFLEELRACLAEPLRPGEFTAVFFIDLDRFKGINDALGHLAGDRFLLEISTRLQQCLGSRGILARFGGDEFTLLVNHVASRKEVVELAETLMKQFDEDVVINSNKVWANASIGVAMVAMPRPSRDDLLSMADAALYNAKAQGKGRFVLYEPNLPRPTLRSISLDTDIRSALERDELELYFQPVANLSDLKLSGLEALIRWNHPRYGLLSPGEFIPLAEETGLIKSLGAWVIDSACEHLSAWRALYDETLKMSVNLSALQFRQKDILFQIAAASLRTGLPRGSLQLEITETVLLQDDGQTLDILRKLRDIGFAIVIDDFGIGYSSLSYLKRFDTDALKLDRSFLTDLHNPRTEALVRGTVQLGRSLGMTVVAEGIETNEHLRLTRRAGCDQGQGYLLGRPMDEKQIIALLTEGKPLIQYSSSDTLKGNAAEERPAGPNILFARSA